ncbi:MAG: DUF533 domain-containing protein [Granulosicoccus sp.]
MSLVGTLGRIAVGVAMAKGVGKMMNAGRSGGGGGLGGALGGALGGGGAGGGLGGLLGSVLGGGGAAGSSGGLGGLGSLLGGGAAGGGMGGGLGGLLESISGGGSAAGNAGNTAPSSGSLGHLLNGALQGNSIPEPEPAQEDMAKILIRAMVNAAKSDGEIDQTEQQKIVANLGDEVSDEERQFVISEMRSPLDAQGFINSIPQGAGPQVYMMSLLGIDLDSREEAQYLDTLRKGVSMSEEEANAIHQKLGVPTLYS